MKKPSPKPGKKNAAPDGDAAQAEIQQAILNALPAHIALLDSSGVILSVNEAWKRFAGENQLQYADHGIGQNYLEICRRSAGHGAAEAAEVVNGLEQVLRGESAEFAIEYPCHSPRQERWFRLIITPLDGARAGAVVMHINITERKLAELERQQLVHNLGERVKELHTLYEVTRLLSGGAHLPPREVLAQAVAMLPAAMQFPGLAAARMSFGGDEAATPGFLPSPWQLEQSFTTSGGISGRIEIVYREKPRPAGAAPFLPEERHLLESLCTVLKNHFERHHAVRAQRESEERLRSTFEQAAVGMAHVAEDGRFLRVNQKLCEILGYSEQELSSLTFATVTPPEEREVCESLMRDLMTGAQTSASLEKRYRRKDGTHVWVRVIATTARHENGGRYLITVVEDISERHLAEQRLLRMNRLYKVLSKIAETIVRAPGLQELYEETCRVLVEEGGLKMALLVWLERPSLEVRPLAAHGQVGQYLEGLTVTVDEGPLSRGTIGTALRTGRHDVCNDFLNDPRMQPWQESAARNGFGSTASFPLIVHEAAAGAVIVFAGEAGYFEADEIELMRTVAADLSFAIEARLREDARLRVEKALRLSQTNMAAAQRIAHFGSWELDLADTGDVDRNPLSWSDEMYRIAGFEPGEVAVSNEFFFSLVPPEEHEPIRREMSAALQERRQYSMTHRLVRPDGGTRLVHETAQLFYDDTTGEPVKMIGTAHDITEQRQMALRLETEHARLATAQRVGKVGSWETDITTLEVSWSEETHRIFETDPASFQPTHSAFLEIVHPDDRERVDKAFVESLGKEGAHAIEHRLLMPDGRVKHVEERWQIFFEDQGAPVRAIGTCQEITERKLAEQEIRRTASLLRAVVDGTPDAIYVKDMEGRYLLFNEGAARLVGKPVEEVLGRDDSAVFDAESARVIRENDLRAMESGQVVITEEVLTAAGVTRTYLVTKAPYLDGEGKVIGLLGISRDVTRSKTAEERLHEQAALLDKAQDAILVRDLEHHILYWNKSAERLYGWTAGEVVGKRISQLLYNDPSAFYKATNTVIEQGEWTGEITQRTKTGAVVIVEGHWSLVRDDNGRPKSILAINTDVTERKKIEQQYLRAQRMESIGTLAGGIAHNLNNVLSPIMMSIELLKLGEENPARLEVLDTIEASARRGADMVRQVLSFARGVEGRQLEVRMEDLLREIEKIANETFLKSILVSASIQPGLWPVKGDPTQLHQVLLNLCVNARDAMPEGGTLSLSASNLRLDKQYAGMNLDARPGPHVLIQIEDSGSGMPPEILERIFEPFFTTKELGKGTGLGLSTSQAIIKSHGGFIRVYSELEKGTRFHVYLPALTGAAADTAFPCALPTLPRGAGELVLLVDDEEPVRRITRQTLEAFGYQVLSASDGAEAAALYATRRHEIAVVITDMMMPIMDGPATIQVLLRMNPQARIIAASGLNANSMVAKATNAGVRHFIPKPYTAETLLTILSQVLHGGK